MNPNVPCTLSAHGSALLLTAGEGDKTARTPLDGGVRAAGSRWAQRKETKVGLPQMVRSVTAQYVIREVYHLVKTNPRTGQIES